MRTLRSEGCNNNVQLIVQSFTFRVSPLPPLSLFNMVMETADRGKPLHFLEPATTSFGSNSKLILARVFVRLLEPFCDAKRPFESATQQP